jgi:phosphohistidine phosphatase
VKQVHVLRHAKSSWADGDVPDRDRPLAPRGRRAARRVAAHLRDAGVRPQLVLCSSAARTRETLDLVGGGLPDGVEVLVEDGLYGASADQLLERLRGLPEHVASVLIVGHNPGLQELVLALGAPSRDPGGHLGSIREDFPTGALATVALAAESWREITPGRGAVTAFAVPRDLAE